jgi:hypothetical protein
MVVVSVMSGHPELTNKSIEFYKHLPVKIVKEDITLALDGHWVEMLDSRLRYDADFIVWVDEDVFLFRPDAIQDLCRELRAGQYGYCGVPENGVSCNRHFNENYSGTFFMIWNMDIIKTVMPISVSEIRGYPSGYFREEHWMFEEYFKRRSIPRLAIGGYDYADNISTVLFDSKGRDFLYLTWLARDWENPETKQRILKAWEATQCLKS